MYVLFPAFEIPWLSLTLSTIFPSVSWPMLSSCLLEYCQNNLLFNLHVFSHIIEMRARVYFFLELIFDWTIVFQLFFVCSFSESLLLFRPGKWNLFIKFHDFPGCPLTRTNPASKGDLTEIYFLKKYAAMNPFKSFVPSVLIDSGMGQIYPRSMLGLPSISWAV